MDQNAQARRQAAAAAYGWTRNRGRNRSFAAMISDDWYKSQQLHFAAMDGDMEKCAQLIATGYDVNAFDEISNTPLHYAAENEHFDVVSFLLRHGADVNALDAKRIGDTPLSHVAQTCSLKMAKLLVDAGADPTLEVGLSRNALKKAKERKRGDGPRVYELFRKAAGLETERH